MAETVSLNKDGRRATNYWPQAGVAAAEDEPSVVVHELFRTDRK